MPDYWMDADSFIRPHREAYPFDMVRPFWDFLETKAKEGIIGSPEIIFTLELTPTSNNPDALFQWAKEQLGILFYPVDNPIQICYSDIVNYVQTCGRYKQQWIASFLSGADPWVIAYAIVMGGKIVTFEKSEANAKRPKIPDIADIFGVGHISLYQMLKELKFKL